MKRLHLSIGVDDLDASVSFYGALFGAAPTVLKDDYAKWMLEDPRINFVVTTDAPTTGVNHLGIQAEDEAELSEVYAAIEAAGGASLDEGETECCYARSTKQWIVDPSGVPWEAFLTHGEAHGDAPIRAPEAAEARGGCCA